MAIPFWLELVIPNLNTTTIIGIVLLALAIFGGAGFRFIGKILSTITGGKIGDNIIVSILLISGIILIWGVSIAQDVLKELFENKLILLVVAIIIGIIALILIFGGKKKTRVATPQKLRL